MEGKGENKFYWHCSVSLEKPLPSKLLNLGIVLLEVIQ